MPNQLNNNIERFLAIINDAFDEATCGSQPLVLTKNDYPFDGHLTKDLSRFTYTIEPIDLPSDFFERRPGLNDLDNNLLPNTKILINYKSNNFSGIRAKEIHYHRLDIKEFLKRRFRSWANFSSNANIQFEDNNPNGSSPDDINLAISKILGATDEDSIHVSSRIVSPNGKPVVIEVKSPSSSSESISKYYFVPDKTFYIHVQHDADEPWVKDTYE